MAPWRDDHSIQHTEARGGFGGGGGTVGVLTEWRAGLAVSWRGRPSTVDALSLPSNERITSANAFPRSLAKSQLETALNGGSIDGGGDRRNDDGGKGASEGDL